MKKLFLFCISIAFFIINAGGLYAQDQSSVEAMIKQIAKAKDDTVKVNTLIEISKGYLSSNPSEALKYATQAKDLAEKINFQIGKAWSLKKMGQAYTIKSDYVNALQVFNEALKIFEANGIKNGEANMYGNLGAIYFQKSLLDKAQDNYIKALKIAEEIKDTLRIATTLLNLGAIYSDKPETFDKALVFFFKALPLSEAVGDNDALGTITVNIGEVYLNRSIKVDKLEKDKKSDIDTSLIYVLKARKFYEGLANLPYALNKIGEVYMRKENFELALQYHQMAYDTAKVLDSKIDMAQALLGMAESNKAKKDYLSAIPIYINAETLFKEIGLNESYDIQKVYEGLSFSYSDLKDYEKALKYQAALIEVNKKVYDIEVDKKLGTKLFAFEIDKKQGEINLQEKVLARQKIIRNGFIGGFAIVLLFAGVFFKQRNKISKEKKRSDELLLNILPGEVAEELKAKGSADAKLIDEVTVIFTDFKGFTQLSEKLTAKELVSEINECFSAFDLIMFKHGVEKIKTIGDSYMAVGGLPTPNKTHATDVIKAALEIQKFMLEHKIKKEAAGELFFEIRIGVHSGPVVAGIVGVKKFAYDIWGDTVNTASRIESSGEVGKVNISETTYRIIKDQFNCEHRGKITAKGKGDIDMYFVEG